VGLIAPVSLVKTWVRGEILPFVKPNRFDPNRDDPRTPARPARFKRSTTNQRRRFQRKVRGTGRKSAVGGAKNQLRQFRQASILAVAITGFLILLLSPGDAGLAQPADEADEVANGLSETGTFLQEPAAEASIVETASNQETLIPREELHEATLNEARQTFRNLWGGFFSHFPKIVVALLALVLAWLLIRGIQFLQRKTIGQWESAGGIMALTAILIWLFAIGVAVSVVAGDIRALIGSLGLVGLALSWSLQTPIESFTAWLLNSFKRYYKKGDRIQVGDVFGDVYKIDFITTTVWEIGAPFRQGFVMAEQPTGRLVTFPNNEILSGSIVNLTRDFPYVWDELNIAVANESDLRLAMEVVKQTAHHLLGDYMKEPAQQYEQILQHAGLSPGIPENPQVYLAAHESWMDIIVRYLVGTSERRRWKSELTLRITEELNKAMYKTKIIPVYPRQQIQMIDESGVPTSTWPVRE
jgi:small-conductance mechanosensitive channel